MNAEHLLQHFERISNAPDAVPRLRRFILDLAVRGKLVEQDPADEPASELVKRIAERKQEFTGNRASRREESDAEAPFSVPVGWQWVLATAPAIVLSDQGKKIKTQDVREQGRFPVVDQGKVLIRGYCDDPEIVLRVDKPIIVFGDHTRETKFIDFDFVVGADGVKLLQPVELLAEYYFLALRWLPLDSRGYGRHFKLLRNALIPIPPLAEQSRIVVKVDELMSLCDELEAAQQKREGGRDRFVVAALQGLTMDNAPAPEGEYLGVQESAHTYLTELMRSTSQPKHVEVLRSAVLELAIRGKLVQQDPMDEPARSELDSIAREKRRLARGGRLKQPKPKATFDMSTAAAGIPQSWEWTSLGEIALEFRYGTAQKCDYGVKGHPVLRIPNVTRGTITTNDLKFAALTENEIEDLALVPGDILFVRSNGSLNLVGRPALVKEEVQGFAYAGYLVRARFLPGTVHPEYLIVALNSRLLRNQIEIPIRTTVGLKNVNATEFGNLVLPLPPMAEQRRIVASVSQLMALCDALEEQLNSASVLEAKLLEGVLKAALADDASHATSRSLRDSDA